MEPGFETIPGGLVHRLESTGGDWLGIIDHGDLAAVVAKSRFPLLALVVMGIVNSTSY